MTDKYKVKKIYVSENYANNWSRNYVIVNRLTISGSIVTVDCSRKCHGS
jgi:hypothetical protein